MAGHQFSCQLLGYRKTQCKSILKGWRKASSPWWEKLQSDVSKDLIYGWKVKLFPRCILNKMKSICKALVQLGLDEACPLIKTLLLWFFINFFGDIIFLTFFFFFFRLFFFFFWPSQAKDQIPSHSCQPTQHLCQQWILNSLYWARTRICVLALQRPQILLHHSGNSCPWLSKPVSMLF